MSDKRLIWIFLIVSEFAFSQIKGIVVDENNKPIPYVNIWVENENIGTTSQEDGTFTISTSEEKNLVFSALGYENKIVSLSKGYKIILKQKEILLKEVVVTQQKKTKEIEIGDSEKIHHKQLSGDKPWIYAKLFPFKNEYNDTPFVKKIIFYSDSEKNNAKIKIRIFDYNDSIPTDDLLQEDLIISVKRGMRKNVIDVEKYNIQFPEKGIVIGLEWMIIDENKFDFEYKDYKVNTKGIMTSYAPSFVLNYFDEENSFQYSGGKWYRRKKINLGNNKPWDNKVMTPAINLILSN